MPTLAAPPKRSAHVALPGWVLSLLFAAVFIIIGLTIIVLKDSGTRTAPVEKATAALETVPPQAPVVQTDPAFRDIELTGLRLSEDAKHKPVVQFVVINHSAGDLGTVKATVHLKAVAKQDQEAVGTFSFNTALGPYEAKDLKAPLDTKLRVYELPDWQFLRADLVGK